MTIIDDQIRVDQSYLELIGPYQWCDGRHLDRETIANTGAEALLIRSTTIVDKDLLAGTRVQFVATATAGTDHVDVEWLASAGITFANAPGSNAWAVAEYVVAWIVQLGVLPSTPIGIVGHGHVGCRVDAALLSGGYITRVCDPPLYGRQGKTLDELVEECGVITLHVPLTTAGPHATAGLMNRKHLARMHDGALIINTSRGGVLVESDLIEFVADGKLGAILDVFHDEPNVSRDTVSIVQQCTPHIAGYSADAKRQGARAVCEALLQWRTGAIVEHTAKPHIQRVPALNLQSLPLRPVRDEAQWFVKEYLQSATSATFDRLRKSYTLRDEVLSAAFNAA